MLYTGLQDDAESSGPDRDTGDAHRVGDTSSKSRTRRRYDGKGGSGNRGVGDADAHTGDDETRNEIDPRRRITSEIHQRNTSGREREPDCDDEPGDRWDTEPTHDEGHHEHRHGDGQRAQAAL